MLWCECTTFCNLEYQKTLTNKQVIQQTCNHATLKLSLLIRVTVAGRTETIQKAVPLHN